MTEYWLQKKTIGGWSMVTWNEDEATARANYSNCTKDKLSGYAWRLVKVEILELQPLEDMIKVEPPEIETAQPRSEKLKIVDPWSATSKPKNQMGNDPIWTTTPSWGDLSPQPETKSGHGLSGSVWVVHHGERKKSRVPANELDKYLANGYIKAGPRTQFE